MLTPVNCPVSCPGGSANPSNHTSSMWFPGPWPPNGKPAKDTVKEQKRSWDKWNRCAQKPGGAGALSTSTGVAPELAGFQETGRDM